ncbi:hypothetical protein LOK49_LG12G00245 [Camellia lanceoleosa]|uniref:Uncharacterized protein n=1 Tax=Camellia lanceoleosa TaxID=1840588 RepID=A0ACC0FTP3_9ERIC|nr:hypothetical protein LOK49_LG12G00245 [Camellia lanceoleosa]
MSKLTHLCTSAALIRQPTSSNAPISNRSRKRARRESPEGLLRHKLDMCSQQGDLVEALRLYDNARTRCGEFGFREEFCDFKQMGIDKIAPNEATFTNLARLAVVKEDPEMAFDLVKKMKSCGIPPKLRSYGPALFGFCRKGMANEAYEVDAHMVESGVLAEESELSALLNVSAETKRPDRVYEMLHRLRATVRQVTEETAGVVEDWFESERAAEVGEVNWDVGKVREEVVKGGGGGMDKGGSEMGIGELRGHKWMKWVCANRVERSLQLILKKNGILTNLEGALIQEWLQRHGPFDAVIDGANVGLINRHNFNFSQLNSVVNQLHQVSPSKRLPLVVLHKSRVTGGPAQSHNNKKLLESWKRYWLFAAVSCKCLLVTNDEMRDHLFQLLGTSFFPRWKEKHQVRLTTSMSTHRPKLHMPPPYSIVIQESEQGSWHVPTIVGDDLETPRQWVCATRARDPSSHTL